MVKVKSQLEEQKRAVASLDAERSKLERQVEEIERAVQEYRSFDPDISREEMARLERVNSAVVSKMATAASTAQSIKMQLQEVKSKTVSLFHPFEYFKPEQKSARKQVAELQAGLEAVSSALRALAAERDETNALISKQAERLAAFSEFDESDQMTELERIKFNAEKISDAINCKKDVIAKIERKFGPLLNQLTHLIDEATSLRKAIAQAKGFEADLHDAANGSERRLIHQECEELFGTGSPSRVANEKAGKLRSVERNLTKLEDRIEREFAKHDRVVERILIDGSNLCYDNGVFIRFHALSHLTDELVKRFEVMVVFDASIRSRMKLDDDRITSVFDHRIKVKVLATKQTADELLLKIAEGKPGTYILSNDRFADFPEYEVVKANRILRFEIADQRIFVSDLDLEVPMASGNSRLGPALGGIGT